MQDPGLSGFAEPRSMVDFSNDSVQMLLESITDGFYFLDNHWRVLYFNKEAERILQISRDEVVGKNIWTCYPEEYGGGFYKRYTECLQTRQGIHFEEYYPKLNLWSEVIVFPCKEGLSVHFRDITDRKQREKQLSEMNESYRLVTKATSGAIWEYDILQDRSFWHHDHFKEIFGYDIVDTYVPHQVLKSLIHPDDRALRLSQFADQLTQRREMDRSEYRFKKADGSYAWVLERTFLQKDENGLAVKLVGCTEDITAFKHAEQELRNSEVNHRLIFQKASLGHIICARDNLKILKVNEAAQQMYGYSDEEFLKLDVYSLRSDRDSPSLIDKIEISAAQGTKYMVSHLKKNGDLIVVEANAVKMEYDGMPCYLITVDDLTYRKHLERQIEDLRLTNQKNITKAAIEAQEKQKEEIAGELHDNVNQVLATAKLILGLITPSDKIQQQLIEKCNETIYYCIEEIRRLSRSFTPPSLREMTLEEAVNNLIQGIPFSNNEKVNVEIIGLKEALLDQGFKVTIYRIIQEQLNNVLKHAKATTIHIRISQNERQLSLLVEDDGKGFDVTSKRNGIGLMNIRNRAEIYNGELLINSAPGAGCQLIISFQLKPEEKFHSSWLSNL